MSPLIFEDRQAQARGHRIVWGLLTLVLWAGFVYMMVPTARDMFHQLVDAALALPWLLAHAGAGLVALVDHPDRLAAGFAALLASGATLHLTLDPDTRAANAQQAVEAIQCRPFDAAALFADSGFQPAQVSAIQQAQRVIAHHDDDGQVYAVTLLTTQAANQPATQAAMQRVRQSVRQPTLQPVRQPALQPAGPPEPTSAEPANQPHFVPVLPELVSTTDFAARRQRRAQFQDMASATAVVAPPDGKAEPPADMRGDTPSDTYRDTHADTACGDQPYMSTYTAGSQDEVQRDRHPRQPVWPYSRPVRPVVSGPPAADERLFGALTPAEPRSPRLPGGPAFTPTAIGPPRPSRPGQPSLDPPSVGPPPLAPPSSRRPRIREPARPVSERKRLRA